MHMYWCHWLVCLVISYVLAETNWSISWMIWPNSETNSSVSQTDNFINNSTASRTHWLHVGQRPMLQSLQILGSLVLAMYTSSHIRWQWVYHDMLPVMYVWGTYNRLEAIAVSIGKLKILIPKTLEPIYRKNSNTICTLLKYTSPTLTKKLWENISSGTRSTPRDINLFIDVNCFLSEFNFFLYKLTEIYGAGYISLQLSQCISGISHLDSLSVDLTAGTYRNSVLQNYAFF